MATFRTNKKVEEPQEKNFISADKNFKKNSIEELKKEKKRNFKKNTTKKTKQKTTNPHRLRPDTRCHFRH